MKKGLPFLFVLLQCFSATAQKSGVITATVVDARTGKPVEGAVVQAAKRSVLTNEQGKTVLAAQTGEDSLHISALGYKGQKIAIRDLIRTGLVVSLSPDIVQLKEMTLVSVAAKPIHFTPGTPFFLKMGVSYQF